MKKCLIIDDIDSNRMATEAIVEDLGFGTISIDNAEDALHIAEQNFFEVILVDWHMPGMNGIEFLEKIRNTKKGRNTVIYIYSGTEDHKGTKEALRAGADGFIYKPVTKEMLQKHFKASALIL